VNTDGGDRPAALGTPPIINPRPLPSAATIGRSSTNAGAFAAAQAHAFNNPRQIEDRLTAISSSLQRHPRGRDPTEHDVHLIALLLDH
jgi:hypothetical protein